MQLTIDVKESALDKVVAFFDKLKSDVIIIDSKHSEPLDIEPVLKGDKDYDFMVQCDKDRKNNPQNYGTMDDIDWN